MRILEFFSGNSERAGYKFSPIIERGKLKLDSNENLFLSKKTLTSFISKVSREVDCRLYPDDDIGEVTTLIGRNLGVDRLQIVMGGGGDQLIELLTASLLREGEEIRSIDPTFGMYREVAAQRRLRYKAIRLGIGFSLPIDELLRDAEEGSMLVVCNPNNPTGNSFSKRSLLRLVEEYPGFVLIDEAYVDYGGESLTENTCNYDNLVVLRTFSKAYGLAGLRVGYIVSNKRLAEVIGTKHQSPFPCSRISLGTAKMMLKNQSAVNYTIDVARTERKWMLSQLSALEGVTTFSSDSNFILFDVGRDAVTVKQKLGELGVSVRFVGSVTGYDNCLRATVAPRKMGEFFLKALREVIE
jgi:histidinol-phosphate aminotransferase